MKNQFFGENRDLLKFDLVCKIVQGGMVNQFVYIPMLTENNPQLETPNICRHGATGGAGNKELMDFLDECIINEKRKISQLERFFAECGIKATIYGEDAFFTHEGRKAYFDGIGNNLMTGSLILIDPDKGLEEKENGAETILFSELRSLYERMDDGSLLMFTQRFPYDLYREYLGMRTAEIKDCLPGSQPISLDYLDSIIFFLAKNQLLQDRLLQMLREYTRQYARKE
jgi:hypothetical protein